MLNKTFDSEAFQTGPDKKTKSISNTLGVYMWSAPIYIEERDIHVILLDFEPFS